MGEGSGFRRNPLIPLLSNGVDTEDTSYPNSKSIVVSMMEMVKPSGFSRQVRIKSPTTIRLCNMGENQRILSICSTMANLEQRVHSRHLASPGLLGLSSGKILHKQWSVSLGRIDDSENIFLRFNFS